jgi:hypothetical protein
MTYPSPFQTLRKKEMPEEAFPAAEWLMPRLLTDLSVSRTIPLKLNHMQHQQALCA